MWVPITAVNRLARGLLPGRRAGAGPAAGPTQRLVSLHAGRQNPEIFLTYLVPKTSGLFWRDLPGNPSPPLLLWYFLLKLCSPAGLCSQNLRPGSFQRFLREPFFFFKATKRRQQRLARPLPPLCCRGDLMGPAEVGRWRSSLPRTRDTRRRASPTTPRAPVTPALSQGAPD